MMDLLKEGLKSNAIGFDTSDSLRRNLLHQCCIFGNLEMLKYLTQEWGKESLRTLDVWKTSLSHLVARNGFLDILHFLALNDAISTSFENRFHISNLEIAIAMGHTSCVDFLIPFATPDILNSALLRTCQESKLDIIKKLVDAGASLEYRMPDIGSTPLDRACYNGHIEVVQYLIQRGAKVDAARPNNTTPLCK